MLQLSERKEKRRNVINAPRMRRGEQAYVGVIDNPSTRCRRPQKRAGPWLTFLRMPGVNRQGQAHIVSTAIPLPRSGKAGREVEATPWLRTRFSIDPQPASISPTINISIVFISTPRLCADGFRRRAYHFLRNAAAIFSRVSIKLLDSSAIRFFLEHGA
jgi:hypothetical protein